MPNGVAGTDRVEASVSKKEGGDPRRDDGKREDCECCCRRGVADADTTPASAVPHIPKTPGTPRTPNTGVLSARITSHGSSFGDHSPISASNLGASLSRLPSGQFDGSYSPNGSTLDESMQVCRFLKVCSIPRANCTM